MKYGYARISTGQTLATQLDALKNAGCERVFREKVSGIAQRKELARLLDRLNSSDVVVVTKLDRLAGSTLDLLRIVDRICKVGACLKSLGDSWVDTTPPHGQLLMTVLTGFAEFKREVIKVRTGEGRAQAKAEGKHLGRFPKLTQDQQREVVARLCAGEAMSAIAKSLNVSRPTISRLARLAKGTDLEILLHGAETKDAAALVSTFGH